MSEREALLSPEILDGLGDLEWVARLLVRSVGAGIHRSARIGRGEDFERHRPYQQGDDLRHLDWRLLGRTDRLHVRRFRESSSLRAVLVLDATPSMDFADAASRGGAPLPPVRPGGLRSTGVTKLRYAALLAAAMGHLFRLAGDLPGLAVSGGEGEGPALFLRPRSGLEAWHHVLHALTHLEAGSPGSLVATLEDVADRVPPGARIVLLSDFLEADDGGGIVRTAALLRARGDEVTAVRILTPEELGEGGGEDALYWDPERPERTIPGSPARDPGYRVRVKGYYGRLSRALEERGVEWFEARTTDSPLLLLRGWIRGRERKPWIRREARKGHA